MVELGLNEAHHLDAPPLVLDQQVLAGGETLEYSFNIIAGAPGCGKTTLAHQIMFANATPERPAL